MTVGDPAGIGPEIVAAAARALPADAARLRVYGDLRAVDEAGGLPEHVERRPSEGPRVKPGQPDPRAADALIASIEAAARDCLSGELDAMTTAPLSKEVIAAGGHDWPGHTELLEAIAGRGRAVMLLVGGQLRVALATIHCALRDVPGRLHAEGIAEVLEVLDRDLRARLGVEAPRLGVCGLNPHAGEGGRFGDEEARVIAPALERARAAGIDCRGPFAADSLFARALRGEFDAILGMYHDQALGPLKTHAMGRAVNITLGLPLIRTSVDHGTAFDIAGRGRADPGSMIEALRWAIEMGRRAAHGGRA